MGGGRLNPRTIFEPAGHAPGQGPPVVLAKEVEAEIQRTGNATAGDDIAILDDSPVEYPTVPAQLDPMEVASTINLYPPPGDFYYPQNTPYDTVDRIHPQWLNEFSGVMEQYFRAVLR